MKHEKLYRADELVKKFHGKFINTYPHHTTFWNDKTHKYETVWEVRGVKTKIRENYETPEEVVGR